MKELGTLVLIEDQDLEGYDIVKPENAPDAKGTSILVLMADECSVHVDNGYMYTVLNSRGVIECLDAHSTKVFYDEYFKRFIEFCEDFGFTVGATHMQQIFNSTGHAWFGCGDFYVPWLVDEQYQQIKQVSFTEPAVVVGSSRVIDDCGRYVEIGYFKQNLDFFDYGLTASGKWFVVQQGQIKYFDTLEFQKFLEEEINKQ